MSTFLNSYVSRVLFATPAPGRVLGATARRSHRLTAPLFDPSRPELNYTRAPSPKWREKQRAMYFDSNTDTQPRP
jgi:hypothetical protein